MSDFRKIFKEAFSSNTRNLLKDMRVADQKGRHEYAKVIDKHGGDWEKARDEWIKNGKGSSDDMFGDSSRHSKIKALITKHISEIAKDPEMLKDAWTLVQHMDHEVDLQNFLLPYLKGTEEFKYLYDRIAVNTGKEQKYGTQRIFKERAYHGSKHNYDSPNFDKIHWVTTDPDYAKLYSNAPTKYSKAEPIVYTHEVNVHHPATVNKEYTRITSLLSHWFEERPNVNVDKNLVIEKKNEIIEKWHEIGLDNSETQTFNHWYISGEEGNQLLIQFLKLLGYDCIFYLEGGVDTYGLFGPENLKEAVEIVNSLKQELAQAAQVVYDQWLPDEEGGDDEWGGGGICHLIADAMVHVLDKHGIEATTMQQEVGENHTFTVGKTSKGIYVFDISPYVYENGGGYTWTKIPDVQFTENDVAVNLITRDLSKWGDYLND